jgi:hypothetical protein
MIIDEKLINKLCKDASASAKASFQVKIKPSEFKLFLNDLNILDYELDNYIKRLFENAKRDFEASKILARNGTYPLSVYHLQQCIEKMTKAYGLFSGYIKREELYIKKNKSIGHISPKTFVFMLQNKELQKKILIVYKCSGRSVELDSNIKRFSKLIKNQYKLANTKKSEIKALLDWFKLIHRRVRIDKREALFKSRKFKMSLTNRSKKYLPESEINKLDNMLNRVPEEFLRNMDIPFNFLFLWFLSVITYPHFIWTRYPKEVKKQLDPSDYKQGLGIVDSLKDIHEVIDRRLIKRTDQMLKDYTERRLK